MKDAREDQTASLLQNSHVLVAGGFDGTESGVLKRHPLDVGCILVAGPERHLIKWQQ